MKDSMHYKDWFQKSDEDFAVAKLLFKESDFMDTVGFHLHQAIEKYLKGFLLFNDQDYPLIHNLTMLLQQCGKFDNDILDYSEECERLNGYFISSKYPVDPPTDYPKEEMQKSIEMAEFLIKYISKKTE
ncbi:MAG: HEPN domain-containing protein [bacterium]